MGEPDCARGVSGGVMGACTAYVDGGARNNPGPAGAGFVLLRDGKEICAAGAYLGEATNNVAEYYAVIWAMENAQHLGIIDLEIRSDSLLVVNQLRGDWKVKHEHMKQLFAGASLLTEKFDRFKIMHIPREENERADELANAAMDARTTVGTYATPLVIASALDLGSSF
ncbi:MAG: ribonuclease HI family protein [Coriobacteriia bacterium]|nr:ribonuclease HI family protein [Coriobacteriia bacterium]